MTLSDDLTSLIITLKLAGLSTLILIIIGTPLASWLSQTRWRFSFVLETLIALPLVLPPTVLGFYLLMALGPKGPVGQLMQWLDLQPLAFTFAGLVVGSVIYSMPFVVQPLQNAFATVGRRASEQAATLRASPLDCFFTVIVPMTKHAFITAAVLGFAHTVGEFGVVLMIGGNIPGQTKVLSIAIYDHVEALEYSQAYWLSGGLLLLSVAMLLLVYGLGRRHSGAFRL